MAKGTGSTALTVKLRAMYGKRLTPQNYRELLRKQNVSEIAAYIKQNTSYADVMRDINENSVHRGQLENVIRRELFNEYQRMLNYVIPSEMKFYRFFLIRMEIDELLSCIRYLSAGHQGEYSFSLPSYFADHANFDLYGLAKVKSFDELMNLLKETPYAEILRKFDPGSSDKLEVVRVENEFNKYYYSVVFRSLRDNFSGAVRESLRTAFGIEIDLENIIQVLRMKKYFNESGEYVRALLLPFSFRISQGELNRMIDAPDMESALQVLNETWYCKYYSLNDFDNMERFAQQIIYGHYKSLLYFSASSAISVVAYLQLKRLEIRNLISIIEGVRYSLNPSDIEKLLIGTGD